MEMILDLAFKGLTRMSITCLYMLVVAVVLALMALIANHARI